MSMASRSSRTPPPPPPDDEDASFGAWTLIWVLYATKLVTIVAVVWAAHSYEATVLVTATTWIWLGPLIVFTAAPLLFRYRLHRIRARRTQLLHAEWTADEPSAVSDQPSNDEGTPYPTQQPKPQAQTRAGP